MDKIKHPKRYKAYLKGCENGRIRENGRILENHEKHESEKAEIRKHLELSKATTLDYYKYIKELETDIKSLSNKFGEGLFIGIMLAGLFWGIMALIWRN